MSMEKRGVIDENTPQHGRCACRLRNPAEPHTKEAADEMESHTINDMIDAVADQTDRNRG